mmetsp:Transcript_79567/g.192796  ORF Transcript_79567/g.192796 Transcript_79567/m.192796 type:complete len:601 (-) Transcript_79567:30-1832(-)
MNSLERRGVVWSGRSVCEIRGRPLLGVGGGLVAHLEVGGLDVARGTDAELDGDVHGRPERAAVGDGDVRGVVEELALNLLVDGGALVDGDIRLLLEVVVEARRPLARAEARGVGAVVHHERDAAGVHVGVEGVDSLDDGLVANLGEGVALLAEGVNLRHHAGAVDARGEGVEGDVLLDALRADLLANLPHRGRANLPHRELVESLHRHDDAANLVRALHLLVALVEDVLRRHVRCAVRPHELVLVLHSLVHRLDALRGDDLRDRPGDALHRVLKRVLRGHALLGVPAVERFDDAMHPAEQDAALAENIRAVLHLERRRERERRPDRDGPAQGDVRRVPRRVLVDGERRVDARAANLLALLVETTHGRAHALRRDEDDVDVLAEGFAVGGHDAEKEAVGEAEGGAGLHGGEDARVHLSLRGIGDEEHDEVGLGDDVEGLAEGAVLLGEAARAGLVVGLGGRPETDADLGVHAGLLEGVAKVLRLRGRLGAPADDADGVDALERLGKLLEEVAATADDVLALTGDIDELLLEHLGVDVELGGGRLRGRGGDDAARELEGFPGVGFSGRDGLARGERGGARGRGGGRGGHRGGRGGHYLRKRA